MRAPSFRSFSLILVAALLSACGGKDDKASAEAAAASSALPVSLAPAQQQTMAFAPGATWVCFSDQTSHAVMSGQYMLEQTFHLPADAQYDTASSPLAILTRLTGRTLI